MPSEVDTPVPRDKPTSIPNGVALYHNGSKYTVPLQGSMLGVVIWIGVQIFSTFGQMKADVTEAKQSLNNLVTAVENVDASLTKVSESAEKHEIRLNAMDKLDEQTQKSLQSDKDRLAVIETCIRDKKACKL